MKLRNTVILHNGYAEIIIEKKDVYRHIMFIDSEDIAKIGKVRISNQGYAYCCQDGGKAVAHVVLNHISNIKTVVDHINGNRLDNRKANLRIVSQLNNNHNKHSFSRNNTGTIGISYRVNGKYEYYRASVTNRGEIFSYNKNGRAIGKRYTKQFNINKLGKQEAFRLANEWLSLKKIEFDYKTI